LSGTGATGVSVPVTLVVGSAPAPLSPPPVPSSLRITAVQ
jgi:hypothetical protein